MPAKYPRKKIYGQSYVTKRQEKSSLFLFILHFLRVSREPDERLRRAAAHVKSMNLTA